MSNNLQSCLSPTSFSLVAVIALTVGLASCSGGDDPTGPQGTAATLVITPDSSTIHVGDTETLTADVRDSTGLSISSAHVVWTSLDDSIATVDQGGVVTGVAPGEARVKGVDGVAADTVIVFVVPSATCEGVKRVASWHVTLTWSYAQDLTTSDGFHVTVNQTADLEGTLFPLGGIIPTDTWIGNVTGTGSLNDHVVKGAFQLSSVGSGPLLQPAPFQLYVNTDSCTYSFAAVANINALVDGTAGTDEVGSLIGTDALGTWQSHDLTDHGRTFPAYRLDPHGLTVDAYIPGGTSGNLWEPGSDETEARGSAIVSYTIHKDSTRVH